MIPVTSSDLDSLVAEGERQLADLDFLVESLDSESLAWRPDSTRWSIVGHVEHLNIVNTRYLEAIEGAIASARARGGLEGDGPYRHPFISRHFVRSLEPPPRRRLQTFRSMVPDPGVDATTSLKSFAKIQNRLGEVLEGARGIDLGRVRFSSPFLSLLRLSLGAGLELLLAHNRRHLWLVREVMARSDFPGASSIAD